MKYMGSKNRIAKYIVPIIQSYINENTEGYLEPFVGGANVIDKINFHNKIGYDIEENIINLLIGLQNGWIPPKNITEEMYIDIKSNKNKYDPVLYSYVAYQLSYGAKMWGGYRRDSIGKRNYSIEAYNNVIKQAPYLKDILFKNIPFQNIQKENIKNYVIYCDIPYRNTTSYKAGKFPYDEFYQWVKDMSVHNRVLISEYNMPDEFDCIWQKEHKTLLDNNKSSNDSSNIRVEKLYTYNIK